MKKASIDTQLGTLEASTVGTRDYPGIDIKMDGNPYFSEHQTIRIPQFCKTLGLVDQSWHNDACPKAERVLNRDIDEVLRLWVAEDALEDREIDMPRFIIEHVRNESEHTDGNAPQLYSGDDAAACEAAIVEFLAARSSVA
jgi:hypothetical protein